MKKNAIKRREKNHVGPGFVCPKSKNYCDGADDESMVLIVHGKRKK